jgi:hypothetical protein
MHVWSCALQFMQNFRLNSAFYRLTCAIRLLVLFLFSEFSYAHRQIFT